MLCVERGTASGHPQEGAPTIHGPGGLIHDLVGATLAVALGGGGLWLAPMEAFPCRRSRSLSCRFKEKSTLRVHLNSATFFTWVGATLAGRATLLVVGKDKAKLASFSCFPRALHPNLALHGFD
jgi:hypothetical protein